MTPGQVDRSSPSRAEVKNACSYTSIPPIRLHGTMLRWAEETLPFTLSHFRNIFWNITSASIVLFYI